MTLTVRYVDANFIQQIWNLVKGYIEESVDKGLPYPESSKCYNADHILQFLTSGQQLLLVAIDEDGKIHGAATISFINYPLHRAAVITAIGGKLVTSKNTFEQMRQILAQRGATIIQAMCRPSMVRYLQRFNFEPRNTLVEVLI